MTRIRRTGRWLLIILGILLLVPVILIAAGLMVLRSETGTAWIIEQVPGLATTNARGSLLGVWRADSLSWRGYGIQLDLKSPYIDWSPGCLWHKTLCLDYLLAEQIDLVVQEGSSGENAGPVQLPGLDLPLNLTVGDVRLGRFRFNDTLVWDDVELMAEGAGTSLNVTQLSYHRDDLMVDASGWLHARGDWPLDLGVSVSLPEELVGESWQFDLALGGSVRDLQLRGDSRGYLDARFEGQTEPLDPDLPARLTVESESFLAMESLPPTLELRDWSLDLKGSLAHGFQTRGKASLPGSGGPVELALSGLATTDGAEDIELTLSAPYHRAGEDSTVVVAGAVRWADVLTADATLRLSHFPWYDLVPGMAEPPAALHSLDIGAHYEDGRCQADVTARTSGPLGDTRVRTDVEGDLSAVALTNLEATTGAGNLKGQASLAFAERLEWDADVMLSRFNPGYWLPELQADLNGEVTSSGHLGTDGLPVVKAGWDLAGSWRKRETRARGQLEGAGGAWQVSGLDLSVGDNRIHGAGRWAETLAASLNLDIPNLGVFLPGLEGSLSGEVKAAGTAENPTGQARLEGSGIRWRDSLDVDAVTVEASLKDSLTLDARLDASGIEAGGQTLSELNLDLVGTMEKHELVLTALNEELSVQLGFAGAWGDGWIGVLNKGEIQLPEQGQTWALRDPATLEYEPAGRLTFGAHCWRWQSGSVCAEDQTLLPDPDIHYRLNDFPASALAVLLPETVRWEAAINGELRLTMTGSGPDGRVELDAAPGKVEIYARERWQQLTYHTLNTRVSLKPEQARFGLTLGGTELGELEIAMNVDPRPNERPVEGSFSLSQFDLALVGSFLDLEEVAGELKGEGTFSGPLLQPMVQGEIAMAGGRILDPSLPLPLEDIALSLTLKGDRAEIAGRWRSNERSEGKVAGDVSWADGPVAELRITGDRLPVHYEPYARLELAPDITLRFLDGNLNVQGSVDIPRGEIEIRELPEQAVSVSEDEVIVGQQEQQPALKSMNMNITLKVGQDRLTFAGFGVAGDLEGTLRVGNNLDTRGALRLNDGSYQAYGQELELRRARLVFVGAVSEPYLDIEAIRRVGSVTAGIRLSGPLSEPRTEVFSEPSMSQSEALAYLILGRPLRTAGDQGQLGQAALSMGLAQTSELTRGLGEELGIRNLTLQAEGSGEEAAVVASGYLTDKLSVRYGVGVFDPISTVALRYDLGRYFYLEAASGLASSLDLFYTRDF